MQNQPLDYSAKDLAGKSQEAAFYFNKPGLMPRIKSTLIDVLVVMALMGVAAALLNGLEVESGAVRGWCFVGVWLYEPLFTSIGRTLGQVVMGLQVRRLSDLKNGARLRGISIPASVLRFLLKCALGWISLLTIHSDRYGQAIHDKAANSVMLTK